MARLIYAFLALSLGTLVAGFLIRDSSIPLLVSIGLSAVVLLLILVGTSRRLRRSQALEDEQDELASLEVVEIDAESGAGTEVATSATTSRRRPRPARRRAAADDTATMDAIDDAADEEPEVTEVVERPAKRSRRKAAASKAPPKRKAGTIVEPELERDSFPEFAVDPEDDAASDDIATGTDAGAEPPPTIQMPAERAPARPRRRASASAPAPRDAATAVERPALTPKVWVIPGRSRYHTHGCRFAKGDTLREVTEATAVRRGYVPCSVCKPGSGA